MSMVPHNIETESLRSEDKRRIIIYKRYDKEVARLEQGPGNAYWLCTIPGIAPKKFIERKEAKSFIWKILIPQELTKKEQAIIAKVS